MPDDDIVSFGEHGSEDAFDRRELLKKSGRLAAAGALVPSSCRRGGARGLRGRGRGPDRRNRGAASKAVQGDHADNDPRDGPTGR